MLRAKTCALLTANIKEAAFGRLHKGGRAAFGHPPPFVESLMDGYVGAGKAADAPKSCINMQESHENERKIKGTYL